MIKMKEIKSSTMNVEKFIENKVQAIREAVGPGLAINALSGGVDSCVVTALGHKALGPRLKTYIIDNGIMRENEPAKVAAAFKKLGIKVEVVNSAKAFFAALKGLTDPEEKREAITQTFYKNVFGNQIEIRCWDSLDARVAKPTRLSFDVLEKIAAKITKDIPEVVSVTYNITSKPTSTIEAI